MSMQSFFWTFGRLVCGGVVWLVLPLNIEKFHSWRLLILLSAMPAFVGALLYVLLPESPRFLLEVRRERGREGEGEGGEGGREGGGGREREGGREGGREKREEWRRDAMEKFSKMILQEYAHSCVKFH